MDRNREEDYLAYFICNELRLRGIEDPRNAFVLHRLESELQGYILIPRNGFDLLLKQLLSEVIEPRAGNVRDAWILVPEDVHRLMYILELRQRFR